MILYNLELSAYNDGEYEDYRSYGNFYGVFSTIEKAKEYAEKKMEQTRKNTKEVEEYAEDGNTPLSYRETFTVNEDWHESGNCISKEVSFEEGSFEVWTQTYCISKVTVDPEFKED